jgi:hypothetical protein
MRRLVVDVMPSPQNRFGRDVVRAAVTERLDYVGGPARPAYLPCRTFTIQSPWNSSLLVDGGRYIPYAGHSPAR